MGWGMGPQRTGLVQETKEMKAIAVKPNSKGIRYALVTDGVTFSVYVERENYCRHARGGIAKSWRYVERGMTREAAEALFNRRTR